MLLVCIEPLSGRLTLGKEYSVVNSGVVTGHYVWVISDDGVSRAYLYRRFKLRSELRHDVLSSIGI